MSVLQHGCLCSTAAENKRLRETSLLLCSFSKAFARGILADEVHAIEQRSAFRVRKLIERPGQQCGLPSSAKSLGMGYKKKVLAESSPRPHSTQR